MADRSDYTTTIGKGTATPVWMIQVLTLATAPFFGGATQYGFHSVEWSYFAVSALAMYLFLMWLLLREIGVVKYEMRDDVIFRYFLAFMFLALISLVDAPAKTRGLLFLGQYMPYMFTVVLMVNFVRTGKHLDNFLSAFYVIAAVFMLIVIAGGLYFGDRVSLNLFMLRYLNISVNKVLPFVELPFCIALVSLLMKRVSPLPVAVIFLTLVCITATASRGSLVILVVIFILSVFFTRRAMKAAFTIPFFIAVVVLIVKMGGFSYSVERVMQRIDPRAGKKITSFSRLFTAQTAIQTIKDNPLNGVGVGNLSFFSEESFRKADLPPEIVVYWKKRTKVFETTSTPLRLGAEMGIGGIIFFMLFYLHLFRRLGRAGRDDRDGDYESLIAGHKIFVLASFIHNFADAGFMNYYTWFFYGSVIALCNIAGKPRGPRITQEPG